MAEFYRFFDSTIEDKRLYNADEFAEYFRRILTNGIFNGGTNLKASTSGTDMNIDIADGFGWINGYLYKVQGGLSLTVDPSNPTLNRIDRVVIRWDKREEARYIKAFVIKGTESEEPTPPELTRTNDVYELSLAQVFVESGKSFLTQESVTDERLNTSVCGLVNSLIQADTTEIFNKFNDWYSRSIPEFEKTWKEWLTAQQEQGYISVNQLDETKTELNKTIEQKSTELKNEVARDISNIRETVSQANTNSTTAIQETKTINTLKVVKSGKDSEGIYTTVTYRRKSNNTIYCVSTLSGGTSPQYTTRTEKYYNSDGTQVTETVTFTLSYDSDGNLISEV